MYLTQYIERMGTGTGDMIRSCVEAGLPEPEFTVTDGFRTIVWRAKEETRGKILSLIAENPYLTMDGMAEKIGITSYGIEWQLRKLKESGLIKRTGPKKGGYREIVKSEDK